ncbi:MAG: Hpt domain-containing protein [Syntrophomonadaceae bacterium]|nr:Hpt domain-containing protein [Syntrophomonadaceae bacterium]
MDEEILKQMSEAGIDGENALKRFSGNMAIFKKILLKFPNDKSYDALQKALDARNYEEAERACHTLKGVAGNMGMTALFELCAELHTALHNGNQEVDALFQPMQRAYREILDFIDTL